MPKGRPSVKKCVNDGCQQQAPAADRDKRTPRFRTLLEGDNPNKHTQQGTGMLASAMGRHGYVAPMTAARNGVILDGNLRLETSATTFPDVEPIIVEHDGTRPIVCVRKDIKDEHDPCARDIITSANRIAEVDLEWDVGVLKAFAADGLDLAPFEFPAVLLAEREAVNGASVLGDALIYRVIVDCANEQEQARLLARLEGEGLLCRALIS